MNLALVGVSHETASVAVRERVAVPAGDIPDRLTRGVACEEISEALLLSTCNRSELYAVGGTACAASHLSDVFAAVHGVPPDLVEPHLYTKRDMAAARHIFMVAAGADSMVLGETEIMGQIRQATQCARAAGRLYSGF